jgi:hypothetical protein
MRTFVRVSLLGNAFLDLACILLLLSHGRGNQPREAAFSRKPAEARATVDNDSSNGAFAVETPLVSRQLSGSYPGRFPGGNMMPDELVQFTEIPRYTTGYKVNWLSWHLEGKPLDLPLGEGAYARASP